MKRESLYYRSNKPDGMEEYLSKYGWHFNKKAFEYAVSQMKKADTNTGKPKKIESISKESVEEMLKRMNIVVENNVLYDAAYVANMCKADYLHKSITDEAHLAMYVRDTIDDEDAVDGEIMVCWHAKMMRRGIPVEWEELL